MSNRKEVERRTTVALAAIKRPAGTDSSVDLFASHHLEEVEPAYWQQHTGTSCPSRDQILDLLELRSHWSEDDLEDGIEVFDFTLPGDVTQYVIAVKFDKVGEIKEIALES